MGYLASNRKKTQLQYEDLLFYTQKVAGSSPASPTKFVILVRPPFLLI